MKIKKVCVIGMGTMGSQIGVVCARGGCATAMVDTSSDQVERGMKNIESFLHGLEKKGKIDGEAKEKVLSLITAGTDIPKSAKDADLVIEAVYEDIAVKKDTF